MKLSAEQKQFHCEICGRQENRIEGVRCVKHDDRKVEPTPHPLTSEMTETIKARPADNYVAFNEAVKPSWIALKGVFLTVEERDWLLAHLEAVERDKATILTVHETTTGSLATSLAAAEAERDRLAAELATCWSCEYEFEDNQAIKTPERRRNVVCGKCWPATTMQAENVRLAAEVTRLTEVVQVVLKSVRDDEHGEQWTIRAYLDKCGIYHENMSGSRRLVREACERALTAHEEPTR